VISVQVAGAFKPHPGVYLRAASLLELEAGECMMVSANSFDVMGARACGFRGAFVNRYGLPYEDTPFRPDVGLRISMNWPTAWSDRRFPVFQKCP